MPVPGLVLLLLFQVFFVVRSPSGFSSWCSRRWSRCRCAVKLGLDVFPDGRLKDLLEILHVAVVLFVDLKYCHTRLPLGKLSVMMFEIRSL